MRKSRELLEKYVTELQYKCDNNRTTNRFMVGKLSMAETVIMDLKDILLVIYFEEQDDKRANKGIKET